MGVDDLDRELDATDRTILKLLAEQPMYKAQLARQEELDLSAQSVGRRISRLEDADLLEQQIELNHDCGHGERLTVLYEPSERGYEVLRERLESLEAERQQLAEQVDQLAALVP